MINKILELLTQNPTVSIISIMTLMVIFLFLFKEQIKMYLIKKFDLYTKDEMVDFSKWNNPSIDKEFISEELNHWTRTKQK